MIAVGVDVVVGDSEVVGVVVGVEAVKDVVVHLVVGPHAALVAVRVHAIVHTVDVGPLDVTIHVGAFEHVRVRQIFAEATDLPGEAVGLRVEPPEVAHRGVDDILHEDDNKKDRVGTGVRPEHLFNN